MKDPRIDLVQCAGRLLYGEHWQSRLAQDVGCSDRIFRRWMSYEAPIPNGVFHDIFLKIQTQAIDLRLLEDQMRQFLPGQSLESKETEELEQMVIREAACVIDMPHGMSVTVLPKGDSWEALPNSHSAIAYVDQCREIHKAASRLRQKYSLAR